MAQDEMNNKKKWKLNTEGMEVQNASSGYMTYFYLGNLYKSIAVSRISPMYIPLLLATSTSRDFHFVQPTGPFSPESSCQGIHLA